MVVVVEGMCFDGGCAKCGGRSMVLVMSVVVRVAVVWEVKVCGNGNVACQQQYGRGVTMVVRG